MFEQLLEYDRKILVYLNNLGIEQYDFFWSSITKTAFWIPLFILFIYVIQNTWKGNKPWISQLTALGTFLCTMALTLFVKAWVARLRPSGEEEFSKLIRVLHQSESFSFFSGHAANSFALTTVVVLLTQRRYPWVHLFYLWPILFSFSRIYVGVHYPSDILVGMLVGMGIAFGAYALHNRWRANATDS
ncbi:phosphatase PAP2 family protein [Robertkochia flava]|uniref:phosphatase PAP2 family protein n=1 Tax=Robertkochia flava TaxID=3447986 RepID=UPI001CCCCF5A|nr:phosphatase PAP2 family protein [Robertkochia marina]